jgi:hypothetical protein
MTNRRVVDEFKNLARWVEPLYDHCSGYVHLSSTHVEYFLGRSKPAPSGSRTFEIGDEDAHVPETTKKKMNEAFQATTKGLLKLSKAWLEVRETHGTNEQLKLIYAKDA